MLYSGVYSAQYSRLAFVVSRDREVTCFVRVYTYGRFVFLGSLRCVCARARGAGGGEKL